MKIITILIIIILSSYSSYAQETESYRTLLKVVNKRHPKRLRHVLEKNDSCFINFYYSKKTDSLSIAFFTDRKRNTYAEFVYLDDSIAYCEYISGFHPKLPKKERRMYFFSVKNDKFYPRSNYNLESTFYEQLLKKGYELYEEGIKRKNKTIIL